MFDIHLHNTLSNRRELFSPRDEGRPTMYVCGPTVYGPAHVGNARPAAVFDVLFRLLRLRFGDAAYIRNITDIDDKIIAAATADSNGDDSDLARRCAEIARRWRDAYQNHMRDLGALSPTAEPQATDHLAQMIAMIETLLKKQFAYEAEGHVLFHAASFGDYGALSNRKREEMIAGARVEVAPYKKDPADFVLWKPSGDGAPGWASPWGRGRPGWHIECSAMAAAHLGEEIDIHGGGQDLIFPHHENEIAQSRCAHGAKTFARYWLHNGHVNFGGEKMSKSEGNTFLLQDALRKFPGEAARWALLSAHYRRPLQWSEELLADSKAALDGLYRAADGEGGGEKESAPDSEIVAALSDDLNTPLAFSLLHEMARRLNKGDAPSDLQSRFQSSAKLLGFLNCKPAEWFHFRSAEAEGMPDAEIEMWIAKRREARARRDFAAADAARDRLTQAGIVLEDSATATSWRRM